MIFLAPAIRYRRRAFDPTALDLLNQFVPLPNRADGTFQAVPVGHERSNQATLKVDHELTKNQHLAGYYYFTQHYLAKPFARFQSGGANAAWIRRSDG